MLAIVIDLENPYSIPEAPVKDPETYLASTDIYNEWSIWITIVARTSIFTHRWFILNLFKGGIKLKK